MPCISCPYWRLLLPVKGLPHLCRLPFHGTEHSITHSLRAARSCAPSCYLSCVPRSPDKCLSKCLGTLHLVRRVCLKAMGWVVPARGIRYVHTIALPAGRNSLKELPGWDPARGQTALSWLPKWRRWMGPGDGHAMASMEMVATRRWCKCDNSPRVHPSCHPRPPRVCPSAGQMSSQPRPGGAHGIVSLMGPHGASWGHGCMDAVCLAGRGQWERSC